MASGAAGPIDAGIVVRRTIKGAEMTAFWVALRWLCALSTIHTDNIDILSGLRRGEKEVHWPESEDEEEDLRIKIWEDMRKVRDKDIGLGAKPVKAHRTKKRQQRLPSSRNLSWREMKQQLGWRGREQIWMVAYRGRSQQLQWSRREWKFMQLYSMPQPSMTRRRLGMIVKN